MARTITNQIIDNYYDELSKVRIELTKRIKDIVKDDITIYDTSDEIDDKYYELPTFYTVNKHSQYDTYSIVEITKDLEIVGNGWDEGNTYTQDITELTLDSLYELYIKLAKGN